MSTCETKKRMVQFQEIVSIQSYESSSLCHKRRSLASSTASSYVSLDPPAAYSSSSSRLPSSSSVMWYSRKELKAIEEATIATMKALTFAGGEVKSLDEEIHCIRGLEGLCWVDFAASKEAREKKRRQLVQHVLQVQEEHRDMGIHDPKGLYMYSISQSKPYRKRAIQHAYKDAMDALRICSNDDDQCQPPNKDIVAFHNKLLKKKKDSDKSRRRGSTSCSSLLLNPQRVSPREEACLHEA